MLTRSLIASLVLLAGCGSSTSSLRDDAIDNAERRGAPLVVAKLEASTNQTIRDVAGLLCAAAEDSADADEFLTNVVELFSTEFPDGDDALAFVGSIMEAHCPDTRNAIRAPDLAG